jgi:hypothetical protein
LPSPSSALLNSGRPLTFNLTLTRSSVKIWSGCGLRIWTWGWNLAKLGANLAILAGMLTSANGPSVVARGLFMMELADELGVVAIDLSQPVIPIVKLTARHDPNNHATNFDFRFALTFTPLPIELLVGNAHFTRVGEFLAESFGRSLPESRSISIVTV